MALLNVSDPVEGCSTIAIQTNLLELVQNCYWYFVCYYGRIFFSKPTVTKVHILLPFWAAFKIQCRCI